MRGSRYFLLGLALAIAGGALAIDTGGLPSFPRFLGVTVKGTAPQVKIQGTTTGTSSSAYQTFTDSAGARLGYVGNAGTGTGDSALESDNGNVKLITNAGSTPQVSIDGGATFQSIQKYAVGSFSTTPSACVLQNNAEGTANAVNIASCVRQGTGDYDVNFTAVFPHAPQCFTTPNGNVVNFASATVTATGVEVRVANSSATLIDGTSFSVFCEGN
jgi:hypothetical protein